MSGSETLPRNLSQVYKPVILPGHPRTWVSTDFVNDPSLLAFDPLEPGRDAISAARIRIQQTRFEIEAGFLEHLSRHVSVLENRETIDICVALDLAFVNQNDPAFSLEKDDHRAIADAGSLCHICRRIDLHRRPSRMYFRGLNRNSYHWILGSLGDLSRRESCKLCSFLLGVLKLNACDYEIAEKQWRCAYVRLQATTIKTSESLKYFRVSLKSNGPEDELRPWNNPRKLDYCISSRAEGSVELQQVAKPVPEKVDIGRVKSWIDLCDAKHDKCRHQPDAIFNIQEVRDFKVLDCWSLKIVQAPLGCRYVALSWVWGNFRLSADLLSCLKSRQLNFDQLPQTIKDAILLGDIQEINEQIAQMHYIYSSAALTVVAATGKDATAGLPGIRPKTRIPGQPNVRIGTANLTTFLPDQFLWRSFVTSANWRAMGRASVIGGSRWNSRSWTYQERLFSTKCLIFTHHQVYLFCRTLTFSEDQILPQQLSMHSTGNLELNVHDNTSGLYRSFLEQYSSRDLTQDNDALNACFSLLRLLSHQLRTNMCWGLPESEFHRSLLWLYQTTDANQWSRSKRVSHRRHEFPSWSWAAWSGSCLAVGYDRLKPSTTWYRQTMDGRLEQISTDDNPVWLPLGAANESTMQQWDVEAQHERFPIPVYNTGRPAHRSDSGLLIFWAISASFAMEEKELTDQETPIFDGVNYTVCRLPLAKGWRPSKESPGTYVQSDTRLIVPREWWRQQQQGSSFEFILVGVGNEQVAVLLIQQTGEFACRIAPHFIDHRDWLNAHNHEWKLILLA